MPISVTAVVDGDDADNTVRIALPASAVFVAVLIVDPGGASRYPPVQARREPGLLGTASGALELRHPHAGGDGCRGGGDVVIEALGLIQADSVRQLMPSALVSSVDQDPVKGLPRRLTAGAPGWGKGPVGACLRAAWLSRGQVRTYGSRRVPPPGSTRRGPVCPELRRGRLGPIDVDPVLRRRALCQKSLP